MPGKTHKYGIKLCDPNGRLTMSLFIVVNRTLQKKAWLPRCWWHCAKNIFKLMTLLLPTTTIQAYLLIMNSPRVKTIWLHANHKQISIARWKECISVLQRGGWQVADERSPVWQHSVPTVVAVQGMLVGRPVQHFRSPVLTSGTLQTTYIE